MKIIMDLSEGVYEVLSIALEEWDNELTNQLKSADDEDEEADIRSQLEIVEKLEKIVRDADLSRRMDEITDFHERI